MKNPSAGKSLDILYRLAEAGVKINCQLVLCPGVNDGDELIRSINDLTALFPSVTSIACVPVGLTKFRDGLEPVEGYCSEAALKTLNIIEEVAEKCLKEHGHRIVYASDEFYLKAGKSMPSGDFYGDYDQLDNGVGICSLLKDEFIEAVESNNEFNGASKCTIATGVGAYPLLTELVDIAKQKWHNIDCNVVQIINDFFGHDITVSGLITGKDLISQLKGKDLGDRLLLSVSMFRSDGDMMLDDTTVADIEEQLNIKVVQVMNDGYELLNAILDL